MSTTEIIRDWKSGDQIAKHKFATLRGSNLYSLTGQFLGVHLQGADPMEIGIQSEVVARLKKLADES